MTANWKKYWIVICCVVLCSCSTIANQIAESTYEESTQIDDVKKTDVKKVSSAGKTRDTDILKRLGRPYRVLWTSTGEKAYFYYLTTEEKKDGNISVKKIGFTFNARNRLKNWNYIVGSLNDRKEDNHYASVYQKDEDIIDIINAITKRTTKKTMREWFSRQGFAINNTYFYVFVKEGQDIKDGINLVFDFKKNGRINHIAITHSYYQKIAGGIKTAVPVITCDSRSISRDLSELEDSERSAIAYYQQKQETKLAKIRQKANVSTEATLTKDYRNSYAYQNNNYPNGENSQVSREDISKGINKMGSAVNILMTIHDIKSGNISADHIQNIVDNANTLIGE